VIATVGTPQVLAAKQATASVPIVSAAMGDPVGTGLVPNLARPGGNITGLSVQARDLAGKRLELLREAVPDLQRLGLVGNVENPLVIVELRELETTGRLLGLDVVTAELRRAV
jgi:putative tryptophan/tyrosine transport system substrate-binding protein